MESERFVVRVGSGLYRKNDKGGMGEGTPYHRRVAMIWDTKPQKKKNPLVEVVEGEDCVEVASKKAERMNRSAGNDLITDDREKCKQNGKA